VQLWSRLGRLKRSSFPKLTGGGQIFGGGASPGLLSVLAGRLLCDTYLSGEQHGRLARWLGMHSSSAALGLQARLLQQMR
jgi:DNA polymerase alpha subunit A